MKPPEPPHSVLGTVKLAIEKQFIIHKFIIYCDMILSGILEQTLLVYTIFDCYGFYCRCFWFHIYQHRINVFDFIFNVRISFLFSKKKRSECDGVGGWGERCGALSKISKQFAPVSAQIGSNRQMGTLFVRESNRKYRKMIVIITTTDDTHTRTPTHTYTHIHDIDDWTIYTNMV